MKMSEILCAYTARPASPRNTEKGFGWGSMLGALALTLLLGKGMAGVMADYRATSTVNEAAEHMEKVSMAVARYVKDNHAVLTANLPLNGAAETITLETLKSAGYFSTNLAEVNPYGQSYSVRVRYATQGLGANTREVLEPLVVTEGGRTISDRDLLRIAGKVQAGGAIRSADPNSAIGNAGGWQISMADFGGSPGAGHLAVGLFYSDAGMLEDYLYRHDVPGRPEVNQMATDLDMTQNAIRFTAPNGQSVWMENETGRLRWVDKAANVELASLDTATGNFSAAGRLVGGEHLQLQGVAVEGEECSPDGLIGRNEEGLILSCQSGVWISKLITRAIIAPPTSGNHCQTVQFDATSGWNNSTPGYNVSMKGYGESDGTTFSGYLWMVDQPINRPIAYCGSDTSCAYLCGWINGYPPYACIGASVNSYLPDGSSVTMISAVEKMPITKVTNLQPC